MRYLIILLLVGCGSEYEPEVTWSGNITEQNEKFILSYDTELFPESQLPKVEQWWIDVQTCAGIGALIEQPLIIEYVPDDGLNNGSNARIVYASLYIRVEVRKTTNVERQTKHEMIHYLLDVNGENRKNNNSHESPWFSQCVGPRLS